MLRKTCWLILLTLGVLLLGSVGYAPAQIGGGPPTFQSHSIDQAGKTVNFLVNASQGFSSGWVMAHNTGTGQDVQLNGTAQVSNPNDSFPCYQVTVNYASLGDGTWQFTLWARDNWGYTSSLTVETVTIQTLPQILDHSIDQSGKTVNFTVNDNSGISLGWVVAHNTGTGQDIQLNGTVSPIMMDGGPPTTTRYLVSSSYSTLADGNWQFTVWARNNAGNTANLTIETVTIDQTPPQITFYNGSSPLSDHGSVTDLSGVKIGVADNLDPNPQIIALSLDNSPRILNQNPVALSYNANAGSIVPVFPPLAPSSGGQEYSLKLTVQDASGNISKKAVIFNYAPPLPTIDSWQANRSDTGLTNPTSGNLGLWQFNTAVSITQIRVTVQPRSYNQVFVDPLSGSCTIPAGQTGCTLNTNIVASAGTMKWYQSNCYVQSQDGILTSSTKSTNFQWDLIPPSIVDHSIDQAAKAVYFIVNEPQTGDFGGAVGLASGWAVAHNTVTGQDVQLSGTAALQYQAPHNGQTFPPQYSVTVNYASLAEGIWQFTLWARDNFGNASSLAAETITIDQTPPQITFYNGNSPLANHGTLTSLDQIKITVTDNVDPNPQVVSLEFSDGHQVSTLSYNAQGGAYVPVFPPLTPSGSQEYSMKMTAKDATGNVATQSVYFTYVPQQVNLPSMNLPAIPANVVHSDGSQALNIPLTNGGAPLSGTFDVMVQSASSSTTTATVRGAAIAPGQQIILSAYNFTAAGGNLILPMRADEPGLVNLLVVSNAPNSPSVSAQFNFWQPQISLTADPGWGVQPFVQTQKIGASVISGPCQATMDALKAKNADPITSPKCLLEFTQKPAAYQLNGDLLQGVLGDSDALEVDYQVSVYSGGQKYVFGSGSHALGKLPITDVSLKLTPTPGAQVTRKLQNVQIGVQSEGTIPCKLTNSQSVAQKYAQSGTVCFVRWTQIPAGLQPTSDNTGALSGALQDPGDQTLTLAADLYTPAGTLSNAFSRSMTLTGINPNPPTIDVSAEVYGQKLDEGKFATSDLALGQFGRLYLKSSTGGNLVLEVDTGNGSPKSYQYSTPNQATSYSLQLFAGALTAWQNKTITARAYYKDMPDVKAEANLNVMGVPSQQVQAQLTATQEATDTAGVPVKLEVGRPGHGTDINYAPEQDGSWEARFGVIDSKQQFNPITDYQDVTGGVLQTTLGGFAVGYTQLAAQARLKPPDGSSGYNREINSNNVYTTIFRGAAPQAKIICRRPSGPAPLGTTVSLQLDNDSSQVLGDVAWEISSDQGASWQPVTTKTLRDASLNLASGQYLVHARLSNRITQQSAYTDGLQMIAYKVPQLIVNGPQTVYLGSPLNLTAQVHVDGQVQSADAAVMEWYNLKKEKIQDGPSLSIPTDTQQVLIYRVRARMKDAPDTDMAAWMNVDGAVRVIAPRPIGAILAVPNYIEHNTVAAQSYTLSAQPVLPMGIDTDHFTIQSEWHLPDGQVVNGLNATYTPTSQDAANKQALFKFVSWIDGYKDQTSVTYSRSIAVGTYTWTAFEVDSKANPAMAPSSVILTARPLDLDPYKLQQPACQWQLPPEAEKLRDLDRGSRSILVNFPNPGDFNVSVQVTDARGSTAQASGTVSLAEAPGCQVTLNPTFSNPTKRELLDVRPQPSVKCAHPQDSLVKWEFSVDDPQAQVMGTDQNALIKGLHAGNWVIHLHAVSKLGKPVDVNYPLTVVSHQPPTCTIKTYDTSDARWFNAACKDPDGRIVATRWFLNDQQMSLAPTLQIKRGTPGVLRFEAENDAGGKYNEVLNTP
ncbi:MAG: Ig-like domain-containing protein [Desulfobaccales bacterium]